MKPVTKRLVFYCPGYDPDAETRYRRLFVTAFSQLARRFGVKRKIGPVENDDSVPARRWTVTAENSDWRTETIYEMLRWDDLVLRDYNRSWPFRLPLLFAALWAALRDRVIVHVFRIDWQFGLMMLYPWAALFALIFAALGLGLAVAVLLGLILPLGTLPTAVIVVVIAAIALRAVDPWIKKFFLYLMLDAWIFNWQHAIGRRPDFDTRLDRFCERIVAAVRATDAQEVLIVGHSTGSVVAVQVAARALARAPELGGLRPEVALLTIGAALPLVGSVRKAEPLRRDVLRLVTDPTLLWVDYQAPQDPLNACGFDPVRDFRLDLGGRAPVNPATRSPRFKDVLSPETYKKIRYNFFRIHFQFLMANEIPGEYDYLMIACGPVSLRDRIAAPAAAIVRTYGAGCVMPAYLAGSPELRMTADEPTLAEGGAA